MIIIFLARFAMSMHLKEILLFILVYFIVILRFRIFLVLIRFEIQLWKLRFFVKCCFRFVRGVLRWGFGGGRGSLFVWVLVLWAGLLLFGNFVFLWLFGFVGLVFIRFIKDLYLLTIWCNSDLVPKIGLLLSGFRFKIKLKLLVTEFINFLNAILFLFDYLQAI